jgi:hypothetical protein
MTDFVNSPMSSFYVAIGAVLALGLGGSIWVLLGLRKIEKEDATRAREQAAQVELS